MGGCNRGYNLAMWDDDLLVGKFLVFKLINVKFGIPCANVDSSSKKAQTTQVLLIEGKT